MKRLNIQTFVAILVLLSTLVAIYANTLHRAYKTLTCPKCFPGTDYNIVFSSENIIEPEKRSKEIMMHSIQKLNNLWHNPVYIDSIPYITHHIYFTSETYPKILNPDYSLNIAHKALRFNQMHSKWRHIIWTNNKTIMPEIFHAIPNIEIRHISEFKDHALYEDLLSFICSAPIDKGHFSTASDIARLMMLEKFGGIYMDLDYELYQYQTLIQLMRTNNFITGIVVSRGSFFEANNSMIASKPEHIILKTSMQMIQRNLHSKNKPAYILYPCSKFLSHLSTSSPINFTVAIYKALDTQTDILLPIRMIYNIDKISPKITMPDELYGIQYQSIPIGDDQFSGSWNDPQDQEFQPCLQDLKTEQLKLIKNKDHTCNK
jgi:hypothetical protein